MDNFTLFDLMNGFDANASFQIYIKEESLNRIGLDFNFIREITYGNSLDISVYCIRDGKEGRASGTSTSAEEIKKLLTTAYNQALLNGKIECNDPYQTTIKMSSVTMGDLEKGGTEGIEAKVRDAFNKVECKGLEEKTATFEYGHIKLNIVNSRGGSGFWQTPYARFKSKITLKDEHSYASGVKINSSNDINKIDISGTISSSLKATQLLLSPRKISPFNGPIVLSPSSAAKIMRSLIIALSATNIINSTSFLKDAKTGSRIASKYFSLVEDPSIPDSEFSRPFDDQLTPTTKKVIIENGILKTNLCDRNTAKKMGIEPTGNYFHKSIYLNGTSYKGISITNAIVKNGVLGFDKLLSNIEEGVYIVDMYNPNPTDGKFSGSIKGVYIKDGKISYAIKDAIVKSDLKEVLGSITSASSESETFENINVPYLVVDNITITSL